MGKALFDHLQDQAIHYYVNGKMSLRQVENKLGISDCTVRRLLVMGGNPVRTSQEGLSLRYPNGRHGKNCPHWKGGRRLGSVGGKYIYIHKPDHPYATKQECVMEHRLVMEEKLGRFLKPNEIVHHIKGKYVMGLEERIRQLEDEVKNLKSKIS